MDIVDLMRLTDVDFEALCKDIFEEILGTRLEIFAPGADGGVDLRAFHDGGDVVVQCKHWQRSGGRRLLREMQDVELPKVRRLAPQRYLVATSADLTKSVKDDLFAALTPWVQSPADIYGAREVVAELRKRPKVVEAHPRLWFSSAAVLTSLLGKEIAEHSRDLAADIVESLRVYVPNASYTRSLGLLEREHVCVIAGLPGIGKTTLAHALCAAYRAKGYDLVAVAEDVDEANRAWDDARPQVFYYDDFLGQNTLDDKLHKNEDARLLRLLTRVADTPNKRFVLTTRDYILAQAKDRYERLSRKDFTPMRCVVDLADYTELIRAEILYNHVFFSALDAESKANFARAYYYTQIIEHENFNPRLVALTLTMLDAAGPDPGTAAAAMIANLDDPEHIWTHIVENQLAPLDVDVLLVLFTLPFRTVDLDVLEVAVGAYRDGQGQPTDSAAFRRSLRTLDGTMITITRGFRYPRAGFHNPSIVDFLASWLADRLTVVTALLCGAVHFEQVQAVWALCDNAGNERFEHALRERSADLVAAAIRTVDFPPLNDDDLSDEFRRPATLLGIWAWSKDRALRRLLDEHLAKTHMTSLFYAEELRDLLWALDEVGDKGLLAHRRRLLAETADLMATDVEDWTEVRSAVWFVEDLDEEDRLEDLFPGEQVPKPVLAVWDAAIVDAVGQWVNGWFSGDANDVEALLSIGDSYDLPVAKDPDIPEIRRILTDLRTLAAPEAPSAAVRQRKEDKREVARLLSALATPSDADRT